MYKVKDIQRVFRPLVGFRNPIITGIAYDLQYLDQTTSCIYVNDQHPLLTKENLFSLAPDPSTTTYQSWLSSTQYYEGDVVESGGSIYVALSDNINTTPSGSSEWQKTNDFEQHLREKLDASIIQLIEDWIARKFQRRTARNLLERKRLFPGAYEIRDEQYTTDGNLILGHKIEVPRNQGLIARIERVGFQYYQPVTFTIYLFKSDTKDPVKSATMTISSAYTQTWVDANWELEPNSAYFVAYFLGDLGKNPAYIDHTPDLQTYGQSGYNYWPYSKFFSITGFSYPATKISEIWPLEDNIYTLAHSYGINLEMSASCDYTELLIEQAPLFASALSMRCALTLLQEFIHNPQSVVNRNERTINKDQLLYEIEGDPRGRKGGLRHRYEQALDALQFDFTGIDTVCLPCRKRSAKYGSI